MSDTNTKSPAPAAAKPTSAIEKVAADAALKPLPATPLADAGKPNVVEMSLNSLQERLDNYLTNMAKSRAIDPADGAIQQIQLWRTLQWVMGRDGAEFTALWGRLLKVVNDNRQGVFSEAYVNRFTDQFRPSSDRRNFERTLHLLLTTCDPTTRQYSLKQLDMRQLLAGIVDNNVVQRIVGFYHQA
jgi:hypothetical protein